MRLSMCLPSCGGVYWLFFSLYCRLTSSAELFETHRRSYLPHSLSLNRQHAVAFTLSGIDVDRPLRVTFIDSFA